jgi:hypothetical protein
MRKTILLLAFLLSSFLGFNQSEKSIIMNDNLIKEYFEDFVAEASDRGFDIQDELLRKLDYIVIVPKDIRIDELSETDIEGKFIKLDSNVLNDRLMLKVNLYRELSYVLGIPYNKSSVMMDRHKVKGFSYSAFDDVNIMDNELDKVLSFL